jgi:hypothetical protein
MTKNKIKNDFKNTLNIKEKSFDVYNEIPDILDNLNDFNNYNFSLDILHEEWNAEFNSEHNNI